MSLWSAFAALSSQRLVDGYTGYQPIPVSEIAAYCDLLAIDEVDEREWLLECVTATDRAFLAESHKQRQRAEQQRKANRKPSGPKPRTRSR